MRKVILILIILFWCVWASAQSATVSGKVMDKKGEPIPFAHIRIEGTYSGTLTNLYGNFQLNGD